ncbi:hypothetical protein Sango_0310500 [Sesamum angolense]|uniref:Protein LOW PSII ACCUMULATION 1, chloroplastic n=1 Tax=Sesamum angolense TaxID=2727404 RepID=A0AAE1X8Q2_9LAMI|nr:hypothetical protein Sango_0310500 [Sesamum angolense]
MAAVAWLSTVIIDCPSCNRAVKRLGFSRQINGLRYNFAVAGVNSARRRKSRASTTITCFASNGPSPSEISSTAKIRSEVLSPFRSVRMFFYLAFVASGSLGGFIAFTQLLGALANSSRAADVPEILKGLGIDLAAVSVFAFLYYRENNAKNAQVARLSREESLSNLKLRVDEKRILSLSAFRGIARLVILAGPAAFIEESFKLSQPFSEEEGTEINAKRKRLWQLAPVYVAEWTKWLDEQKKMANISPESPVYLSLRMDGRVRGSGVGYPPWNAFVVQLPPVKGIWSGLLDGMDGRVL